jgi:hypothetical protein
MVLVRNFPDKQQELALLAAHIHEREELAAEEAQASECWHEFEFENKPKKQIGFPP